MCIRDRVEGRFEHQRRPGPFDDEVDERIGAVQGEHRPPVVPAAAGLGDDQRSVNCLLYTSDAADERSSVDLGGRRIIKKKIKERGAGGENDESKECKKERATYETTK